MAVSVTGVVLYAMALGGLGFLLPSRMGIDFLDGIVTACYAAAGPIFATALIGANRREVWAVSLFGWISSLLSLALALVTINLRYRLGRLLLPPPFVVLAAVPFSLASSYMTGVIGHRLLSSGWKPTVAKGGLRRALLLLLLVVLFVTRYLPAMGHGSAAWLTDRNVAAALAGGTFVCLAIGFLLRPRDAG
jgi:hypothetical protein